MISSYNSSVQTAAANGLVLFDTDRIKTGHTITHTPGSTTFYLNRAGYYFITFNAIVGSESTGNVVVQLRNGSDLVPGAVASANVTATTDVKDVGFSTIVRIPPSCCAVDNTGVITIINTGIEATLTSPNINITKLC